jgi:hypothetical protein
MTGVYERWYSSTLHIGWGMCDSLCLVLGCRGRYGLAGGVLLFMLGSNLGGVGPAFWFLSLFLLPLYVEGTSLTTSLRYQDLANSATYF